MTPGSPGFVGAPALGGAPPAGLPASATPSPTHALLSHQRASSSLSPSLGQNGDAKGVEGSGWHGGKPGILPGGSGCSESLLDQPSVPWLPRRPRHHPSLVQPPGRAGENVSVASSHPACGAFSSCQAPGCWSQSCLFSLLPRSPAASWRCGVRALPGMASTSGWAWGSAQPPGPFSLWIVNQGEEAGGWGTCIPTQSPRLRPHCLAFPDDAGIQGGTTPRGCEAGARAQRGSPAGLR